MLILRFFEIRDKSESEAKNAKLIVTVSDSTERQQNDIIKIIHRMKRFSEQKQAVMLTIEHNSFMFSFVEYFDFCLQNIY